MPRTTMSDGPPLVPSVPNRVARAPTPSGRNGPSALARLTAAIRREKLPVRGPRNVWGEGPAEDDRRPGEGGLEAGPRDRTSRAASAPPARATRILTSSQDS